MFVFNRDAVRELRRQLARVVALLSDDKERVVRLVSYMRGQATIGGGGTSLSLVKNEAIQSAAAATSATTSNNNTDDESSSMQLSAVDCGEWLLGRVVVVVGGQEENNNDDDDDANDDDSDGEKKATNEVRSLLLAAGVDEATVKQTVKELNWKVRAQRGGCFCCFLRFCLLQTRAHTTCLYVFNLLFSFCAHSLAHAHS